MKTISMALRDEVHYPLSAGFIENRLLERGLNGSEEFDAMTAAGDAFKGAVADCLVSLITAPNVSDNGVSISLREQKALLQYANRIYAAIGEEEVSVSPQPKVRFMR